MSQAYVPFLNCKVTPNIHGHFVHASNVCFKSKPKLSNYYHRTKRLDYNICDTYLQNKFKLNLCIFIFSAQNTFFFYFIGSYILTILFTRLLINLTSDCLY